MNAAEAESNVIPMPNNELHPALIPEAAGAGNLDKIRDILFGAQMRDYERRFFRLEERVTKEAHEAREDIRRRFDTLESFIKQELTALGDRLRANCATRGVISISASTSLMSSPRRRSASCANRC
jgi:hypothetical protein